jgi:two-component system nitrogen regulation sensor histidine kinase NtrY
VVVLGLVTALLTFVVFTGYTPIVPTDAVVVDLFCIDAVIILVLLALVAAEAIRLLINVRSRTAGARLHLYIVGLFSITAAIPAIVMAVVGSVTLERGLYPAFMQDVRGFISHTADAARLYREAQCNSLLRESDLTASDLDRAKVGYTDRAFFQNYFTSRVHFLGFTTAVMMKSDGSVVERVDTGKPPQIAKPEPADFEGARKHEPICFVLDNGNTFVSLRYLPSFEDTYLYLARPVDPFSVEFSAQAKEIISLYDAFDKHRRSIQVAFIIMYGLLAAVLLLSSIWLGLSFANQLVTPIRRLIRATDQVSSGNLYVQVPVRRQEGDLAHLSSTFNKMTSELRAQQNKLIVANKMNDERRIFTEAVLSGVPAAVIGVGDKGQITVVNASVQKLLSLPTEQSAVGASLRELVPELGAVLDEARAGRQRLIQSQVVLMRGQRERTLNVRVATDVSPAEEYSHVITLDDITDLITAQRTSAWADVARRIAHEIKNPLTPIQLSAERLKRRYGRVITDGREVFDQCIDTIVRQVDDIKRMVDEFSAFARMPKPMLEEDDVRTCVEQVLFLMREGHPEIAFEADLPPEPMIARFDRRLLTQALTNITKNATEGIAAVPEEERGHGRIEVMLRREGGMAVIDIVDNGKGFPAENRQRLLEPYMTTRSDGTGLGLAIVAKIFEDHGGGIELLDAASDGRHSRGARVRLSFPLPQASAPSSPEEVKAEPISEKA